MKRHWIKALGISGLAAITGCASAQPQSRSVSTGFFNYTNRYIGNVVVDGAWIGGADAYGQHAYSQGLMAPSDPSRKAVLKVEWDVGSLYDVLSDTYTRTEVTRHKADVPVAWPYPANPRLLILHFYPDGRVEAELEENQPRRRIPKPAGYQR